MKNSDNPPQIALKMDKCTFGYAIKRSTVGGSDLDQIRWYIGELYRSDAFGEAKVWSSHKYKWTFASLKLSASKLRIAYGCTRAGKVLSFSFNPSKLTLCDLLALRVHLGFCLFLGSPAFVSNCHLIQCELAADIPGAYFGDYYYVDTRAKAHYDRYVSSGTSYLGAMSSGRRLAIYDKAKEQADRFGLTLSTQLLRIEARLRLKGSLGLDALREQSNPFGSLLPVDKKLLQDHRSDPCISSFARLVLDEQAPPQHAFNTVSARGPASRRLLKNRLKDLRPAWWSPDDLWQNAPSALEWADSLRHQC